MCVYIQFYYPCKLRQITKLTTRILDDSLTARSVGGSLRHRRNVELVGKDEVLSYRRKDYILFSTIIISKRCVLKFESVEEQRMAIRASSIEPRWQRSWRDTRVLFLFFFCLQSTSVLFFSSVYGLTDVTPNELIPSGY